MQDDTKNINLEIKIWDLWDKLDQIWDKIWDLWDLWDLWILWDELTPCIIHDSFNEKFTPRILMESISKFIHFAP